MLYSKFIIEGDNLIMAKCKFHKELATDVNNIKGGGWFVFNDAKKAFIFRGDSHDFGPAKLEDIKKCIKLGNVYGNSRLSRNMSNHKFYYDTKSELIPLN